VDRDRFPGLRDGWVRLDWPAGTQMVGAAIDAAAAWMRSGLSANHGGAFRQSQATDALVADARAACAELLGAAPEGIAFAESMTSMTMRVAAAAGRTLGPGDEVVVTRLDHDGNVRPWVIAAERAGATVRWVEPEPATLDLPPGRVASALTPRTRWVAVTAASNVVGTAPDVGAIAAAAHEVGARIYVDAVAAVPHLRVRLDEWGADALVCSAYKWYGPHVGVLAARPALLAELHPDKLAPSSDAAPERWELGTPPYEALSAVRAAARFMLDRVVPTGWAEERRLGARMDAGLRALPRVTVHGRRAEGDSPTSFFSVSGRRPRAVAEALAAERIAVWNGNSYALELSRLLGLEPDGAVRAGLVHYNEEADVDRLLEAVARL